MNINYQTPSSGNEKISVRIEFEPPLSGYEEVKPRLLSMKADAEESLGMVRPRPQPSSNWFVDTVSQTPAPQITKFTVSRSWLLPLGMMASLLYVTLSPPLSNAIPPYLYPGSLIRDFVGDRFVQFSWGIVVVFHGLESLYTATLVKRHKTPFGVGVSRASVRWWPVAHPCC